MATAFQTEEDRVQTPATRRAVRVALSSAIIGTAVEWYDFYLYATAAAAIFNKLFFPHLSPFAGTMMAYGTALIGFIVRPLGAVFFGHFGDRIGRKRVLVTTLVLMGGATTLMGLLPTEAVVGVWAPILLTVLRALQGFGAGAEYAGAVLVAIEYAPRRHQGLYGAIPYMGVAAGLLLATTVFGLVSSLPQDEFMIWGWRVPFLLSSVVMIVGLILRSQLGETPVFEELERLGHRAKRPIAEVFKLCRREIFCAWGARIGDNSLAYVYEAFVIVYWVQDRNLPRSGILAALAIASAVQFVTVPLFGALTDRIGRRTVYVAGAVLSGALVFPFFWALDTGSSIWATLALVVASSGAKTMMTAAQGPWFAALFPARLRYSGFAIAREVTSPLAGGLAPIVATALLAANQGSPTLVCLYVVGLAALTTVSLLLAPSTNRDLAVAD